METCKFIVKEDFITEKDIRISLNQVIVNIDNSQLIFQMIDNKAFNNDGNIIINTKNIIFTPVLFYFSILNQCIVYESIDTFLLEYFQHGIANQTLTLPKGKLLDNGVYSKHFYPFSTYLPHIASDQRYNDMKSHTINFGIQQAIEDSFTTNDQFKPIMQTNIILSQSLSNCSIILATITKKLNLLTESLT